MRATTGALSGLLVATALAVSGCASDPVDVRATGYAGDSACSAATDQQRVCISADGARISDGQGNSVSLDSTGGSIESDRGGRVEIGTNGGVIENGAGGRVAVGADGGSVVAPGGDVMGVAGTTGSVDLSGAVDWRGQVSGQCDHTSSTMFTITAQLPDGQLIIDTTSAAMADVTLRRGAGVWAADYVSNAGTVLAISPGATQLTSAALTDQAGSVVTVTASFDC